VIGMGLSTPAGKDLATNVWCLGCGRTGWCGRGGEPESSRDRSGWRLAGHGDKAEVGYEAADELFAPSYEDGADHPDHRSAAMLLVCFRQAPEVC
jgi:hypothetical protein